MVCCKGGSSLFEHTLVYALIHIGSSCERMQFRLCLCVCALEVNERMTMGSVSGEHLIRFQPS